MDQHQNSEQFLEQNTDHFLVDLLGGGWVEEKDGKTLWHPATDAELAQIKADDEEAAYKENALREAADLQPNSLLTQATAWKENAKRTAQKGGYLVCRRAEKEGLGLSPDLYPGQPVLVGSMIGYATGYESGEGYEVLIRQFYGPRAFFRKVRACTPENVDALHALFLADELADKLMTLRHRTEDEGRRISLRGAQAKADAIIDEVKAL